MKNATKISMNMIRGLYESRQPNGYWFETKTMRHFKTRLPEFGYTIGDHNFFVTRETDPRGLTAFTIRVQDRDTGDIGTAGKFHHYTKKWDANWDVRFIAEIGYDAWKFKNFKKEARLLPQHDLEALANSPVNIYCTCMQCYGCAAKEVIKEKASLVQFTTA